MAPKLKTLHQVLEELPTSPNLVPEILKRRTSLVELVRQRLNGQGNTFLLTPEQASDLNRALLISSGHLKSVSESSGDIKEAVRSESERILADFIETN